ncbi:DUF5958 family protein [Streptomyces solaniscabiei]|uniref:DUF5958 family protein n=1 Tax=Streptomyces solaniscabiei TaxID=2683255 RepID=UPI001CE33C49|nr:DUF5958 family protein [Streptomyces solaniscabiei]
MAIAAPGAEGAASCSAIRGAGKGLGLEDAPRGSLLERRKAFRLLVAVLAVADERRRERFCSGGCGHWWHNLPVTDG